MTEDKILQILQIGDWFNELPASISEALLNKAAVIPFRQGDVIHWQQEEANALYCVLTGVLKVSSCSWEGKEAVLTFLAPGDWFGEIALFDGLHRTHTAQAHEDSQLLKVQKKDVLKIIKDNPEFYDHIIKLLCEKIRMLMVAVEEAALQPLAVRLARRLLMLADSFGEETPNGVKVLLRLPQEELGQMLGTSRQSTNKILKQFEQQQLIEAGYRHIVLKDVSSLKAIVSQ